MSALTDAGSPDVPCLKNAPPLRPLALGVPCLVAGRMTATAVRRSAFSGDGVNSTWARGCSLVFMFWGVWVNRLYRRG